MFYYFFHYKIKQHSRHPDNDRLLLVLERQPNEKRPIAVLDGYGSASFTIFTQLSRILLLEGHVAQNHMYQLFTFTCSNYSFRKSRQSFFEYDDTYQLKRIMKRQRSGLSTFRTYPHYSNTDYAGKSDRGLQENDASFASGVKRIEKTPRIADLFKQAKARERRHR